MKIAQREDFALILMSFLAKNYSSEYLSLAHIAKKTQLSSLFLKHIAIKLKQKKLVESKEGIDGGYRLSRDPKKISVSEIIQALSKKLVLPSCGQGNCRIVKSRCSCSSLWNEVNHRVFNYLKTVSLSDFTKGK